MIKQLVSVIFTMGLVINIFAQDHWGRYSWGTSDREGFTVLLPIIPEQIAKENGEQGIKAFNNFITFNVVFKDRISQQEFDKEVMKWKNLIGGGQGSGSSKDENEKEIKMNSQTKEISICGFSGIEFGNSNSVQQFFLVNDRLYHVWVTGANRSTPDVVKFLNSFSLAKPWVMWKGIRTNENFEGLGSGSGSKTSFEISVCQNIGKSETKITKLKLPTNSPLQFISKPRPVYPEESKKNGIQGSVTLKVTFLKDGMIGNISVIKGINKELNESAIKAAKQINFEPMRKNGKPVTVTKQVQYNFALY